MCGCVCTYVCTNDVLSRILNQGLYLIISESRKRIIPALIKLGYFYQGALKLYEKRKKSWIGLAN